MVRRTPVDPADAFLESVAIKAAYDPFCISYWDGGALTLKPAIRLVLPIGRINRPRENSCVGFDRFCSCPATVSGNTGARSKAAPMR